MMVQHVSGLSGRLKHIMPETRLRIDLVAFRRHHFNRYMRKNIVPLPHDHICFSRHARVHGILTEERAEYRVIRICGGAANHITWIDIFEIHRHFDTFEVFIDRVAKIHADIGKFYISRRVAFLFHLIGNEEILARTFAAAAQGGVKNRFPHRDRKELRV